MTDDDLILACARTAGIKLVSGLHGGWKNAKTGAYWNPLDDSGDAFGLMVKLNMTISVFAEPCEIVAECDLLECGITVHYAQGDKEAATRRAICELALALDELKTSGAVKLDEEVH